MKQEDPHITEEPRASSESAIPRNLPVLPLRDVVIFPTMQYPVMVGRVSSLRAATFAMDHREMVFLCTQKSSSVEDPGKEDLFWDGTVGKIRQIQKLPNGLMKILVEGIVHHSHAPCPRSPHRR